MAAQAEPFVTRLRIDAPPEVTLAADGEATELTLVHHLLPESEAPKHALGWGTYRPRLAAAAPLMVARR